MRKAQERMGTDAPRYVFAAHIFPDNAAIDETPVGRELALFPFDYAEQGSPNDNPIPVRFTVTAKIRPLDLVRVGGKWFLQFDIEKMSESIFAVECGDANAPLPFEEAASILFGA